jgi:ElaB/YqjD/DUF883 family membrane-anchored ribosome-binding protein
MESGMTKADTQDLREKVDALKQDFAAVARMAKDRAMDGTTTWIKEHPFASVGIAAGAGLVVGLGVGLLAGRGRG